MFKEHWSENAFMKPLSLIHTSYCINFTVILDEKYDSVVNSLSQSVVYKLAVSQVNNLLHFLFSHKSILNYTRKFCNFLVFHVLCFMFDNNMNEAII